MSPTLGKVLVIDDEIAVRRLLKRGLEGEGYHVHEAESADLGLQLAASMRPELVLLDLGLPDMPGEEVLRRLREWSPVPVLILTARDEDARKVALLDAGADDYLTKPFSVPELLARLRALERRARPAGGEPVFELGALRVDLAAHTVFVAGREEHLTATEWQLLRVLIQYAGRVVTQRQLLKEVWGPNSVEQSHYLRVYVAQLRKKIEPDPSEPSLILTEPGVGYRLKLGN